MGVTELDGPIVQGKANPSGSSGSGTQENSQEGPAIFNMGGPALMDPRFMYTYYKGQAPTKPILGWLAGDNYVCVNQVPSAIAANNIAASQSPGAGAIVLVSSTGAGITVGASVINALTGATVTGLLAIDLPNSQSGLGFGQDLTVAPWNPTTSVCRALQFVSGGNDSGITFTVTGFDLYGFPMSEAITGANAGTATGKKAWKYIQSITHTGSVATTLTIGTTDIYGFPLRSDIFADVDINWNAGWVTTNTGYVAAVTTSPATTTTGDIRGTYNVQSASDGTKRLVIFQSPIMVNAGVWNLATVTGLLGVAQNLSTIGGVANNGA